MRALSIGLALMAIVATWFVFGPPPVKPAAKPPPGYLKAKGDALFGSSFKPFRGAPVALKQFEGKPLIVYFWATWCVECGDDVRALSALRAGHRADGLTVIGIGVDQSDRIERFARDHQIDYPVFVGGAEGIELSRKMGNLREAMPFAAAVDRQGLVSAAQLGKFGPQTPDAMAAAALR